MIIFYLKCAHQMVLYNEQQSLKLEIDSERIASLPILQYDHTIHVIKTPEDAEMAIDLLHKESVLGFDTESRPAFKKGESYPISIVQLATQKAAYIFQISLIGSLQPLHSLLSSRDILKIGVAIREDLKRLYSFSPLDLAGFIELTHLSTQLGIQQTGLRNLVGILLEKRICKGSQRSNWSNPTLTQKQLNYAAIDAWVCREIYFNLLERLEQLSISPNCKKISYPSPTKQATKPQ